MSYMSFEWLNKITCVDCVEEHMVQMYVGGCMRVYIRVRGHIFVCVCVCGQLEVNYYILKFTITHSSCPRVMLHSVLYCQPFCSKSYHWRMSHTKYNLSRMVKRTWSFGSNDPFHYVSWYIVCKENEHLNVMLNNPQCCNSQVCYSIRPWEIYVLAMRFVFINGSFLSTSAIGTKKVVSCG